MNNPEYPVLLSLFLIILENSGWTQRLGFEREDHTHDLEANEYAVVYVPSWTKNGSGEYEVRFRGTACVSFNLDSGLLVDIL